MSSLQRQVGKYTVVAEFTKPVKQYWSSILKKIIMIMIMIKTVDITSKPGERKEKKKKNKHVKLSLHKIRRVPRVPALIACFIATPHSFLSFVYVHLLSLKSGNRFSASVKMIINNNK